MATSSGATISSCSGSGSGLYQIQNSGSEENLQNLMNERKRKRMISNRESARRSRMRKQQRVDELTCEVSQLRNKNNQIMSNISVTTQHYMSVEAENCVLRAQVAELSNRLQSLNEIMSFCMFPEEQYGSGVGNGTEFVDELMVNSLSYLYANQPILASADMIQY
ncbi:bZIP transcription factor 44-like [Rutidosis leptorrhynchoides]|uniref:bZIP transcription factor 44-like n=1 Tax=Rutidosis leptorrhynchoides TaxID=125765 RepID=UPI003A98D88A